MNLNIRTCNPMAQIAQSEAVLKARSNNDVVIQRVSLERVSLLNIARRRQVIGMD